MIFLMPYVGYFLFLARNLSRAKKPRISNDRTAFAPTISIIIPVHNEETMIMGKIEDTLKLDYPKDKLEVIVFDDGSEDRTLEIGRSFGGEGIKVIEGRIHRGLSGTTLNSSL